MDNKLDGRIALVTGGSSGIGAACAIELARAGADVAVLFHGDKKGARATAARITEFGRIAYVHRADVAEENDVERAFDAVGERLGRPDILVNSAGLNMSDVEVVDMELEQWDRLIGTDLTGTFLASRRFLRDLKRGKAPGAVVNITSIHAFAMRAGGADYTSAKGGQTNLTRTLALECAAHGITVNAIAPGMILTPMNDEAMDSGKTLRKKERAIPAGRAGTAEEVGRLAVYLASPDASYITGITVAIDGGLSLLMGQGA